MKLLLALALFMLPPASFAAEEPEGVYAKYHRAALAGDLDGVLAQSPALRRNDMKGMSPANRDAALKMMRAMMPRIYTVERKTPGEGSRVALTVSGPWDGGGSGRQQVYGTAHMLMENGEWKVIGVGWTTEKPEILASPQPVAAPPAAQKSAAGKAGAEKSANAPVSAKGAPVVGSTYSEVPVRKFGAAQPGCVYKPVMTAQDMENCK